MSSALDHLRQAWRALLATRATALAAVATLALGTGANTAVLAVAYGVLARPLPFANSARLVVIDTTVARTGARWGIRLDDADDWRRRLTSVDGIAAFSPADLTLRTAAGADTLHA